jgi:hypothetical protein
MEITPAGVAKGDCVTSVAGIAFCAIRLTPSDLIESSMRHRGQGARQPAGIWGK